MSLAKLALRMRNERVRVLCMDSTLKLALRASCHLFSQSLSLSLSRSLAVFVSPCRV